jgi:hypothetical protein
MKKINIWKFIWASSQPDTVGPIEPLARHDPLNDDRAVPELYLKPDRPTRHGPFLFRAVSSHAPKTWARLGFGSGRPGTLAGYTSGEHFGSGAGVFLIVLTLRAGFDPWVF